MKKTTLQLIAAFNGGLAMMLWVAPALAQVPDPKFSYASADADAEKPNAPAEWKAQVKGGLSQAGGNSRSTTATAAGEASYKKGADRVSLLGDVAYVEASAREFVIVTDAMGGRTATGTERVSRVTSQRWAGRGRYDRFFGGANSGYLAGQAMSDEPAGKKIVGGGQLGVARELFKDDVHLIAAELGYDFIYELSAAAGAQGVPIHSGRLFVSDRVKLSAATGINLGLEVLTNLNTEREPVPGYIAAHGGLGPLADTRVNGRAQLTTTLWKNVAFGFGFTGRYDHRPAPIGPPGGVMVSFVPRANRLDTLTEASLIVTFF